VWDFLNYQNNPDTNLIEINGASGSLPTTAAQNGGDHHIMRGNNLWPVGPIQNSSTISSQPSLNLNNPHSPSLASNSNHASAATQYMNSDHAHSQNHQGQRHKNSPPSPMEGDD